MLVSEMTHSEGAPRGASGPKFEAREIQIHGRHLRCQVCDFTRFYRREAELTNGSAFFGQDWTNSKADCFVCEQCGFVHWFVRTRTPGAAPEDVALSAEIEVLRKRLTAEYAADLESSRA